MRRRSLFGPGPPILFAGLLALAGCGRNPAGTDGPDCPAIEASGKPVDRPLMAFLSTARALHHEADIDESQGEAAKAIGALERLVAMPAPPAVEVDEVLADTHARLAELRLRQGDLEKAGSEVQAGLTRARDATYFRGHLLEVEGIVEEARAAALADAGRRDEAARARSRAIALLDEAVSVQARVIDRALADGGEHD